MSTKELTQDERREELRGEYIARGIDPNEALWRASHQAAKEAEERGDHLVVETVEAHVARAGPSAAFAPGGDDDLPSVDQLRAKYYDKEIKKGAGHNAALAIACQKAQTKVTKLFDARLAARNAPPPVEREATPYAELLGRAEQQGDDLELAAKRIELARLEFRAELRQIIRDELHGATTPERGRGMSLLVGGGRR